jgi:hypothetical protein
MAGIIATQALLDEARKAYHALMTGTSPRVVVDQNGERLEFVAASAPKLYNYISELELKLGTPCGAKSSPATQYGPASFLF